jgi:chromate transporter
VNASIFLGYAEAKRRRPLFFALLLGLPIIVAGVPSQALTLFDAFYRAGSLVFGGGHVVLRLLQVSIFPSLGPSEVNFVVEDFARAQHKPLFVLISSVSIVQNPAHRYIRRI